LSSPFRAYDGKDFAISHLESRYNPEPRSNSTNPDRWALLTELIEMWTNLANHQPFLTPEESASEFDKISALHAKLLGPQPSLAMH